MTCLEEAQLQLAKLKEELQRTHSELETAAAKVRELTNEIKGKFLTMSKRFPPHSRFSTPNPLFGERSPRSLRKRFRPRPWSLELSLRPSNMSRNRAMPKSPQRPDRESCLHHPSVVLP